jgi:hypothetical protein
MACPHCGCRLVSPSRSGTTQLVCSDSGRPMDSHLQGAAPLAGWRPKATAALILVLGLSVLAS